MTKIMLVEDDKSLREIYGVRLLAEGYDIVSAGDGEEALAVAIKERPALIITDVMMPKISGFDMLDILRSTTETRTIKVIVMTALGSDEQRMRGDQLGADRYLVKSQVGIEDVVRTVHEVLGDKPGLGAPVAGPANRPTPVPRPTAPPITPPAPRSVAPATPGVTPAQPSPAPQLEPTVTAPTPVANPPQQPEPSVPSQRPMVSSPNPQGFGQPSTAAPTPTPKPTATPTHSRVIQPLNDPATAKVNINELLDRELAREAGIDIEKRPPIASTEQERAVVQDQLQQFSNATPSITPTPPQPPTPTPMPTIQIDSNGRVSMPTPPAPTQPPATALAPNTTVTPPTPPPVVR